MSLKPAKPRSIASQLVFLFAPASAFLLFCGLGVFYWMVVRHTFEEDNAVLADKVFALRADLSKADGVQVLSEQLKGARGGDQGVYWVRVLDSLGVTAVETPDMDGLLPANVFPNAQSFAPSGWRPKNYRAGRRLFSLVAITTGTSGQSYTMQVAQDRSADEEFTREFGALAAAVLAFGILASGLIAISVTKRGLRPLAEMTRSFQRVGPQHLDERVPLTGWPRELQPLAVAFDEMLARLEDSFARLSQFSADLAHELRTPIANLRGEAEVALTRPRPASEYREVIESSVGECERLSGIIENLLFLARAEAADGPLQRTRFDGREAIEKIAMFYEPLAEEKQIALTCAGEGEIDADPVLFGRALSNLVENALHFTSAGGVVAISIAPEARSMKVSVKDSGCGIAQEHLPRVFDRFYRVDSSRSSQGTGLGLALVKSIADLHGGSAAVQSEVDRGTSITLTFPTKL